MLVHKSVPVGWQYVSSQNCRACEVVSWVGSSEKGWENAAQTAVREEAKTVEGIRRIDGRRNSCKNRRQNTKNTRVQRRY